MKPLLVWCGLYQAYLEDHPTTRNWLIAMDSKSPIPGVVPLPNGLFMAYTSGGWW